MKKKTVSKIAHGKKAKFAVFTWKKDIRTGAASSSRQHLRSLLDVFYWAASVP